MFPDLLIRPGEVEQIGRVAVGVAHVTADRSEGGLVDSSAIEERLVDVELNRLADDQPVALVWVADINDVDDNALDVGFALPDHRWSDCLGGNSGDPDRLELIHVGVEAGRACVHGFHYLGSDDVQRELTDLSNIGQCVLAGASSGGEHEHRWGSADGVEERIWCQVGRSGRANGPDPSDGTGHNEAGR